MKWPEKWRDQPQHMLQPFLSFLTFVVTQTSFADGWQKQTGKKFPTMPTSPIDALIDKACGYKPEDSPVLDEFVQAVYEELWAGKPEGASR